MGTVEKDTEEGGKGGEITALMLSWCCGVARCFP